MNEWIQNFTRSSVALSSALHGEMARHLLRSDGQEDLCFAIWHPSSGAERGTVLLSRIVMPSTMDRQVHGNVSFEGSYFLRAAQEAATVDGGIALLHSHPGATGWQGLSADDVRAESGHSGQ